ncbi:hypothetical protein TGARI_214370 [Toxoplasma gondii ARI]|uniref:Uncharacterized protein n=2 Tax=Toxoplasma gondii TaxID=5811 RepID=A0A2G8XW87_TOXGO|nr:hypothetical protein TGARI_214370 [Toxoplasma gondii ARI]PIL99275.1 hypothetical protein TGCOUG_214370 [Toxoplasma gondii COUG]
MGLHAIAPTKFFLCVPAMNGLGPFFALREGNVRVGGTVPLTKGSSGSSCRVLPWPRTRGKAANRVFQRPVSNCQCFSRTARAHHLSGSSVVLANANPASCAPGSSFRCFVSGHRSEDRPRDPERRCTDIQWAIPLYYVSTIADARVAVDWILSCCKESFAGAAGCFSAPPQLRRLAMLPETNATRSFLHRGRDSKGFGDSAAVSAVFGTPGQDYVDVLGEAADLSGPAGLFGSSTRSRLLRSSIGVHLPLLPESTPFASTPHALRHPSQCPSSPPTPGLLRDDSSLNSAEGGCRKGTRKEDKRDSYSEETQRLLHHGGRTELLRSLYVSTSTAVILFSFCSSHSFSSPEDSSARRSISSMFFSPSSSTPRVSGSSMRQHRELVRFVCSSLLANRDVAKVFHGAHSLLSTIYWQYGVSASTVVDSQVGLALLLDRLNLESNFVSLFKALRIHFGQDVAGWDRLVREEKYSSRSASYSSASPDASPDTSLESNWFADAGERDRILQNEGGGLHEALLAAHTLPFAAHVCSLLGDDDGAFVQAQMESVLSAYLRLNPDLSTPPVLSFSQLAMGDASATGKDRGKERRPGLFGSTPGAASALNREEPRLLLCRKGASASAAPSVNQTQEEEANENDDVECKGVRLLPVPPGTVLQAMLMYRETDMLFFGLNLGPLAGVAVGKSVSRFPDLKPGDVANCCVLGRSPCGKFLLLDRVGGRSLVFDLKTKRMLPLPSLESAEATSSSSASPGRRSKSGWSQSGSFLIDDTPVAISPGANDEPYKLTSNASLVDMKARFTVGLDERLGKRFSDNGGRPKPYIGQKIYKLGKRGAVKIRKKLPRNLFDDDGRNK